jgi:arylformamidase
MRHRNDPAYLEAQYNNRVLVPTHGECFARWAEASALGRKEAVHAADIRYDDGPLGTLDVFPAVSAANDGPAPVLVFVHGGYWRSLDKSDFSFVAPSFTARGAMVVVPNYGLCPAVGMEDIALQITRAVAWTVRNAAAHGGDPARIAVVGHSAGGHLAAMLMSCRWKDVGDDLPANAVTGAMSISGLFDLDPLLHVGWLNSDLKLTPKSARRLSPAYFPRPKGGKFYTTVGLDESAEFLRQNRLIRDVWGPTAVPVCETVPGKHHFSVLESLVDPAGRLHELALRLLGLR